MQSKHAILENIFLNKFCRFLYSEFIVVFLWYFHSWRYSKYHDRIIKIPFQVKVVIIYDYILKMWPLFVRGWNASIQVWSSWGKNFIQLITSSKPIPYLVIKSRSKLFFISAPYSSSSSSSSTKWHNMCLKSSPALPISKIRSFIC